MFEAIHFTQACRTHGEDRVGVVELSDRVVLSVADGAGGTGSGGRAAEMVIQGVKSRVADCTTGNQWAETLRQLDPQIAPGESTAVVVDASIDWICGASVGDSGAWLVNGGDIIDLTTHQVRKPLLGSGNAQPAGFCQHQWQGLLLLATDGLLNYAKPGIITQLLAQTDFYSLPRVLVESVKLPTDELWDDVGIVICRRKPPQRRRKRYSI